MILQVRLRNETDQPVEYLAVDALRPRVNFGRLTSDGPSQAMIEECAKACGIVRPEPRWQVLAVGAEFSFRVVANPNTRPLRIELEGLRTRAEDGSWRDWAIRTARIDPASLPAVVEMDELDFGSRYSLDPFTEFEDPYGEGIGVRLSCLGQVTPPSGATPADSTLLAFEISNPSTSPIYILASKRRPWLDWEEWNEEFGAWGFHESTRCVNCLEGYATRAIPPGGVFRWDERSWHAEPFRLVLQVGAHDAQGTLHSWRVRSEPPLPAEPPESARVSWGDKD